MRRALTGVAAALAAAAAALAVAPEDDDRPVALDAPGAREAIAAATRVVPGEVVDVARDIDNGKWEVLVRTDGGEYEVELAPGDLSLLRIDYD